MAKENKNLSTFLEPQVIRSCVEDLQSGTPLECLFPSLLEQIVACTHADLVSLYLWEEQQNLYRTFRAPAERAAAQVSFAPRDKEIEAWLALGRKPVLQQDLQMKYSIPYCPEFIKGEEIRSFFSMPLEYEGKYFGALEIVSKESNFFSTFLQHQLELLSQFLALLFRNHHLLKENHRRLEQMRILIDVSRLINSSLNLTEAFKSIIFASKQLLGLDKVAIFTLNEQRKPSPAYSQGLSTRATGDLTSILNGKGDELFGQKPQVISELPGQFLEKNRSGALVLLPMLYQEKTKGFLTLLLSPGQRLLPEELLVAQSFANQAALAIANSFLFGEAQQRAREFSSLFETAQTITSFMKVEDIVSKILDSAQSMVQADRGFIFEKSSSNEEMSCLVATGPYAEQIKQLKMKVGEGITGWVAMTGKGVNVAEVGLDPRAKQLDGSPIEPESAIVVPLKIKDRVVGVMNLSRLGHKPFLENDFRLLTIFSTFAASAIENARLFEETAQMSITDYLTGLYNYRYFFKRLEEELAFTQRHEDKLSLILLDLDKFKKYNDRYGHLEGDRVLAKFGQLLREEIRLSDIAFRYGGEEFTIILPATDSAEAELVAKRLEKRILITFPQDIPIPIRASIGLSTFPEDAQDAEALVRVADERMYAGKAKAHEQ